MDVTNGSLPTGTNGQTSSTGITPNSAEVKPPYETVTYPPSPILAVRQFHDAFRYPVSETPRVPDDGLRDLRRMLLAQEAQEADEAVASDDLCAVAQELADVVYVAYGTALTYGIDLDAVIAEVHRANMTKDRGTTGKAVKGERFVPADVASVVLLAAKQSDDPAHMDGES